MSNRAQKQVLIVIVTFNGRSLIERNLPSVLAAKGIAFDVLVVDNASTDGTVNYLRENFPDVILLENGKNLGFAKANNRAFNKYPNYEYYALLNNDMEVEERWLEELLSVASKEEDVGAIGPRILYQEKKGGEYRVNSAGGSIDKYDRGFDRFDGCPDSDGYATIEEVDFVSGGAVVYRSDAVKEVGGFDERMFFYYEDVDICLRFKDAGWKVMYDGNAVVYHKHMGTTGSWRSGKATLLSNLNRVRSIQRRRGLLPASVEFLRAPLEWLIYSIYAKIKGKTYRELVLERHKGEPGCR